MTTQSEQQLENSLISQLQTLGFEKVRIDDEAALLANLKIQLEKHNNLQLSDGEFKQVLNKLAKGNIFEKAKILRDRIDYIKDDGPNAGKTGYIELINQIHWCKNQYQVTHQVTMKGTYTNRYDVTLLVNGLPLVQIELKRRGLEMKEAFNQTNRYHRHSYSAGYGLFGYIQLFVISNGVNTKYYANNPVNKRDFKQTFYWADENNKTVTQLSDFAEVFLEKCQISKMITKYVVLNQSAAMLMVLRPYQYYAVEAIVDRVKNTDKFGYIWHTTGSGKTLTSFKTAQILTQSPHVHKAVFVVDRKDLDYQTISEFNSFSEGSVDGTNNTSQLVEKFLDDTPLIVTTLQKLNNAIHNPKYLARMEHLQDKRMVFIFDECHRSQFGETHNRIKAFFKNVQMFGFTGTPIFVENAAKNALGKRTTKDLFARCLHKYVITDAIRDENVLKFSVEYIRTVKVKDHVVDIEVEAIDTSEVMEAPERLERITDYIIANHARKTHAREFSAIFCVSNVKTLIAYYELFKQKKQAGQHNLRIGTIFSYQANEDDADADGFIDTDVPIDGDTTQPDNKHSREKLDEYIADYNEMFGTNFSTNNFYGYYKDIGKRAKDRQVDILLVVNMFLTGFDARALNTIYVDKNLKYHGLIQAYSRTNRIFGTKKSQGNIVCFRNLKPATDKAIELFANKDAVEDIILAPYEEYVERFEIAVAKLLAITPTVNSVDELTSEEDEAKFIQAFREIMRLKNVLECFTEFSFDDLPMDRQLFADFRSKYLDLYDKVRGGVEKTSILDDIDFELELIHRDKINVSYIIALLLNMRDAKPEDREKQRRAIMGILDTEAQLRSKKQLIEQFIAEHFPKIAKDGDIGEQFEAFWDEEKRKAMQDLSQTEGLQQEGLENIIGGYLFTEKTPMRDDVIAIMESRPALKDRRRISERVIGKIKAFVETFIDGVD